MRPGQRLFHGGAPRVPVNGVLLPAARLGLTFDYSNPAFAAGSATYDPSKVYVTTDVNVAVGYAARYIDHATGQVGGGWLYEVSAIGRPASDPDFWTFPDTYLMVSKAKVVRVVKRHVHLTRPEQVRLERQYLAWDRGKPMYDDDGYMNPSPEMVSSGVTAVMLRAYGRWLPVEVIDRNGTFVPSVDTRRGAISLIADMHARIPMLAAPEEHPIQRNESGALVCTACGQAQPDVTAAAQHQLGKVLCTMLERGTGPKGLPVLARELAKYGATAAPRHWGWFTD